MNKDEFEGKWKQIICKASNWWGKLTDDDLEIVCGKYEQFLGVVQEKYGYTREAAETEINKRVTEFEANHKKHAAPAKSAAPRGRHRRAAFIQCASVHQSPEQRAAGRPAALSSGYQIRGVPPAGRLKMKHSIQET